MIVTAGVHWYTDVEAGKFLAGTLYNRLLTIPEFVADLEECRLEFN
ncbi:hypothetical protein [Proteus mirabilis]|nr:hypothetical protein [Proteus mirabilis]MBS3827248.1 hypothetical protein [Proteus mirabilis]MBS3838061.1 hypothetical protein [Proteus mirabilis]MDC9788163.1 hypothetical protein [Proteus mirabilis]